MTIDKHMIEDVTLAYIYSYNIAMKEVHNPTFATQIAFSVCLIFITNQEQEKQQRRIDPMQVLMAAMTSMRQKENDEDSDENKEGAVNNEG